MVWQRSRSAFPNTLFHKLSIYFLDKMWKKRCLFSCQITEEWLLWSPCALANSMRFQNSFAYVITYFPSFFNLHCSVVMHKVELALKLSNATSFLEISLKSIHPQIWTVVCLLYIRWRAAISVLDGLLCYPVQFGHWCISRRSLIASLCSNTHR